MKKNILNSVVTGKAKLLSEVRMEGKVIPGVKKIETWLDSAIVQRKDDKDYLQGILPRFKKAQLLFRASERGFRAEAFHSECDRRGPTLTIIRTEFGKTIGGYSYYNWDS